MQPLGRGSAASKQRQFSLRAFFCCQKKASFREAAVPGLADNLSVPHNLQNVQLIIDQHDVAVAACVETAVIAPKNPNKEVGRADG